MAQGSSAGTVLVVDDEAMLLRLVKSILTRNGFQVVTATNGTEAIGVFSEDPDAIDAVLIDAGIPPSGAAETLRSMFALREGVGAVVSSGASLSDELRELLIGCGGRFLSKPFDPTTLISEISAVAR